MRAWCMIALAAAATLPLEAAADTVTPQGRLLNGGGGAAPDGAYAVVFSLWDAAEDGQQLWEEPHTGDPAVEVAGGVFAARLGVEVPLTPALLTGGPRWVQVQVVPDPPLPRQPLGTVPRAIVARAIDCTGCIPLTAMAVAPATALEVAALSDKLGLVEASVQSLEASVPGRALDARRGRRGSDPQRPGPLRWLPRPGLPAGGGSCGSRGVHPRSRGLRLLQHHGCAGAGV